ncbi:MAG TPA: 3-oxoadipate enol-lactonase [Xylella taiwanensis]
MPFVELQQYRLHYRIDGHTDAPWLTFCNSLGADLHMWDAQVERLAQHYRVLRYDRRGHGQSGMPLGVYTVADLGGDVLALWDALGVIRSHFCGLSIGGLTGQWLALNAPERLNRLVVCATAQKMGSADVLYKRIVQVRAEGLDGLAAATMQRWFTSDFVTTQPQRVAEIIAVFVSTALDGYVGCCHAVAEADFRGLLGAVETPLLAIAGEDDPICPPQVLQEIADAVAHSDCVVIPGGHLCNVESPEPFNDALLSFLERKC